MDHLKTPVIELVVITVMVQIEYIHIFRTSALTKNKYLN